jgi:integrase
MRNDECSNYYEGPFAGQMADFIKYKRAQGLKYDSVPRSLRALSRFIAAYQADGLAISKDIVDRWCALRPNENRRTQTLRIVYTTQFLRYIAEKGVNVSLPQTMRKTATLFVPHIYSHEELRRFFSECDKIKVRTPSVMPDVLPVLFRLLLSCGLRISEALCLTCRDVALNTGILTIRNAKGGKDRLIPLSASLLAMFQSYSLKTHGPAFDIDEPFFCQRDKRAFHSDAIYRRFRKILWSAGIPHSGHGPRLHDFRHTFAVYSLKSMADRGIDIYCSLPILSNYLGHATVSATGQYVRLTQDMFPEIIEKASVIAAFVIPGGGRS